MDFLEESPIVEVTEEFKLDLIASVDDNDTWSKHTISFRN